MQTTITQSDEIVLQGDQLFRRDSFLTPIGNINQIIDTKLKEKNYDFLPLQLPPMMKKWAKGHWFGTDPLQKELLCFTEIEYIPFKGARLDEEGTLVFFRDDEDPTLFRKFEEKWTPPSDVRTFVMVPWLLGNKAISTPYIFMLPPSAQGPVAPKIPNVHDNGKICTGTDYKNRNDEDVKNTDNLPLHHIKYGLNCLHEAPANPDLRDNDRQYMQWDEDGVQIDIPFNSSHWRSVTDVRVVEFYKWFISAQQ